MAKQPKTKMPDRKKPDKETLAAVSRAMLRPSVTAANTIRHYAMHSHKLGALVEELEAHTKAIQEGNLDRAEAMLVAQAHTLDTLFTHLAQRASLNMGEHLPAVETYMRLALKSQSQCRATLETLAAIKNPPVVIAKQANIAAGHQQINNGATEPSRARENEIPQNELLEHQHGERLEFAATAAAGGIDPAMAAMGTLDRAPHAPGQSHNVTERRQGCRAAIAPADEPVVAGAAESSR